MCEVALQIAKLTQLLAAGSPSHGKFDSLKAHKSGELQVWGCACGSPAERDQGLIRERQRLRER